MIPFINFLQINLNTINFQSKCNQSLGRNLTICFTIFKANFEKELKKLVPAGIKK